MKNAFLFRFPVLSTILTLCFSLSSTPAIAAKPSPTPDKKKAPAASSKIVLKDPVAVVNGEKISKAELESAFNKKVQEAGISVDSLSEQQKIAGYHQILESLIVDRLIEKQAASIEISQAEIDAELAKVKAQFKTPEEFDAYLKSIGQNPASVQKEIKMALQWRKWMNGKIAGKDTVDEKDAHAYYDAHIKDFQHPDMVRASHILIVVPKDASKEVTQQKEAEAQKALARVKGGEDFATVAKEVSEDPGSKQTGGDLNFFKKEDMIPEFANAAFSQKVGDIGGPVQTKFGYHIIKVTDKKPAGTTTYEEIKDKLLPYLQEQKKEEAAKAVVDDLRSKATVKINLPAQKAAPATVPTVAPAAEQQ
ncbi:MAG: peptidylprolyl isomerase [Chthoniobacterales bacterium]